MEPFNFTKGGASSFLSPLSKRPFPLTPHRVLANLLKSVFWLRIVQKNTECWSQGRAKLRAFPRHLARNLAVP